MLLYPLRRYQPQRQGHQYGDIPAGAGRLWAGRKAGDNSHEADGKRSYAQRRYSPAGGGAFCQYLGAGQKAGIKRSACKNPDGKRHHHSAVFA